MLLGLFLFCKYCGIAHDSESILKEETYHALKKGRVGEIKEISFMCPLCKRKNVSKVEVTG